MLTALTVRRSCLCVGEGLQHGPDERRWDVHRRAEAGEQLARRELGQVRAAAAGVLVHGVKQVREVREEARVEARVQAELVQRHLHRARSLSAASPRHTGHALGQCEYICARGRVIDQKLCNGGRQQLHRKARHFPREDGEARAFSDDVPVRPQPALITTGPAVCSPVHDCASASARVSHLYDKRSPRGGPA